MAERTASGPIITVTGGTNGAGKSSIIGQYLREHGGEYFNPDEVARTLRQRDPLLGQEEANGLAWTAGKELLEAAIQNGGDYTFETTLGGNTIKRLLQQAAMRGHRLVVWYVGLDSPETHIRRVDVRVKHGGHGIPESKIRERFTRSLENLIELLPLIHELRVFDNSQEVRMSDGEAPRPKVQLHIRDGKLLESAKSADVSDWAKPLFAACLIEQKQ